MAGLKEKRSIRPLMKARTFAVIVMAVLCGREAGALTDPTRPSGYTAPDVTATSTEALRLESVLIARDRRVAVINGKTCRVGDSINGARLVAIHTDGAELVREGSRVVLPLLKVKVRKYAQ